MSRSKWQRSGPACGGTWTWKGWIITHCGHPTALWPYQVIRPNGEYVTLGDMLPPDHKMFSGLGPRGGKRRVACTPQTSAKFAKLADAQSYAEEQDQKMSDDLQAAAAAAIGQLIDAELRSEVIGGCPLADAVEDVMLEVADSPVLMHRGETLADQAEVIARTRDGRYYVRHPKLGPQPPVSADTLKIWRARWLLTMNEERRPGMEAWLRQVGLGK